MPIVTSILAKYPNEVFVETGSGTGNGIAAALEAGFSKVISIELSKKYHAVCKERFKNDPRVTLLQGDSGEVLGKAIHKINCPITFWLDGHFSGGDTACGKEETPLLSELAAIAKHPLKNHIILIDDLRVWYERPGIDFNETTLRQRISSINPAYAFYYENGDAGDQIFINDILVAKLS